MMAGVPSPPSDGHDEPAAAAVAPSDTDSTHRTASGTAAAAGRAVAPRRPTTRDVARRAGVSQATVSNVLNHPDLVTPQRREAVLSAIAELGFVRHEGARQLRSGHSRTLGLLLLDAWNPAFQDMARGVEDVTDAAGWNLLMANSARALERERTYLRLFLEERVPGMIVIPHDEYADSLHRVRAGGATVVVVDRCEQGDQALSVAVDDVAGGRLAAEYLLGLGHRRLLFLGDATAATPVHDRLAGMRAAVSGASERVHFEEWPVALDTEGGRLAGERFVRLPPTTRPTAILAAIDMVAIGVIHALHRGGVRVPHDVSVMGYDDVALAQVLPVPLTTVHRPHIEMGRSAARLLLDAIDGAASPGAAVVFRPELVVRSSTASPPVG